MNVCCDSHCFCRGMGTFSAVVLLVTLWNGGCSNQDQGSAETTTGKQGAAVQGQDGPSALMKKFRQAMIDNDEQAFLECCWPKTQDWQESQSVLLKSGRSQIDLKKALVDVNGPSAWEAFTAAARRKHSLLFDGAIKMVEDAAWVNEVTLDKGGRVAICKEPSGFPLTLVYLQGVWYFDSVSGSLGRSAEDDKRFHLQAISTAVETAKVVREKRLPPEEAYAFYYESL